MWIGDELGFLRKYFGEEAPLNSELSPAKFRMSVSRSWGIYRGAPPCCAGLHSELSGGNYLMRRDRSVMPSRRRQT